MATPNYGYEKRQRELEKRRKKEEKLKSKAERKHTGPGDEPGADVEGAPGDSGLGQGSQPAQP